MKSISRRSFVGAAGVAGVVAGAAASGLAATAEAAEPGQTYKPGTYTASAYGMKGYVQVKVTFDASSITDIQIVDENQTVGLCEEVYSTIPQAIIDNQSLAVDSVAGATFTSSAVISAVGNCVTQAGGDAEALAKVEVAADSSDESFDYDVVVVGAGLAGFFSALKAAQEGARVALLEKQGVMGTAVLSSGIMYIAKDDSQVEDMYSQWIENSPTTSEYPTAERVHDLCAVSPDVLKFIDDMGVSYSIRDTLGASGRLVPTASWGILRNNVPIKLGTMAPFVKGGEALMRSLQKACDANGVDLRFNTPVTGFVKGDDGSVAGVVCETKHGTKTFNAGAVVLACGDYSHNHDMVEQYCPESVNDYTTAAAGDTGECLQLAIDAGAVMYDSQLAMSGSFAYDPTDMPVIGQPYDQFPFECMFVDYNGERKVREDAPNNHVQHQYFTDPDRPTAGWVILDAVQARKVWIMQDLLKATEGGSQTVRAYQADTIEELAGKIGVDPSTLSSQLDAYNAACDAGEDADFGKDAQYLIKMDKAPYYAVLAYSFIRAISGGIKTDADFAVVREDGSEIPGLYAVGIASSREYWGDYYPGALAITLCTHGGFVAGRNAADHALKK
jgi:succinate dehydrogenase/fumarate reductase flavoprotein subunit/uncharacterized protein with FMN-binding domain